jgi:hypothetical protein
MISEALTKQYNWIEEFTNIKKKKKKQNKTKNVYL